MNEAEIRAKGFEPWAGGDEAPDDWDGGEVLVIDTHTNAHPRVLGKINVENWKWTIGYAPIIGYKKKVKMNDIPDWARDRVTEIIDGEQGKGWHNKFVSVGATNAFAAYIAEHEQPPVDPDVAIAQEYYDKWLNDDINSCKEAILAAIKASKS